MKSATRRTTIDLGQALLDSASVFEAPEAVLTCDSLSKPQNDASETGVATEEGMPDGENDLLRRILNSA